MYSLCKRSMGIPFSTNGLWAIGPRHGCAFLRDIKASSVASSPRDVTTTVSAWWQTPPGRTATDARHTHRSPAPGRGRAVDRSTYRRLLNHAVARFVHEAQGRPVTMDEFIQTHRSLALPRRGDLVRLLRRSKMVRYDPKTHEITPGEGIPPPWCQGEAAIRVWVVSKKKTHNET